MPETYNLDSTPLDAAIELVTHEGLQGNLKDWLATYGYTDLTEEQCNDFEDIVDILDEYDSGEASPVYAAIPRPPRRKP